MGKRKVKWLPGDNFLVPLADGSYGQGQLLSYEPQAMNSVLCAFSSARLYDANEPLTAITEENRIAILFVTRDLLDPGRWRVVHKSATLPWDKFIDIQSRRNKGFVGTVIRGSGIVADFLSAYHKLLPWNGYHDAEYLDKLLISPDRKPAGLLLK